MGGYDSSIYGKATPNKAIQNTSNLLLQGGWLRQGVRCLQLLGYWYGTGCFKKKTLSASEIIMCPKVKSSAPDQHT